MTRYPLTIFDLIFDLDGTLVDSFPWSLAYVLDQAAFHRRIAAPYIAHDTN